MLEVEVFRPTLTRLVGVLDRTGVRFHLTGGVTAVAYGEPRMTQDIDLVIDSAAALGNVDAFLGELAAAGFYFEEKTVRTSLAAKTMFQILDIDQALKLDLYPESSIPGELARSVMAEVLPGLKLPIAARTDAALSKLIWARQGSHKSRRDCREILRHAGSDELATVKRMADERKLLAVLEQILAENDPT